MTRNKEEIRKLPCFLYFSFHLPLSQCDMTPVYLPHQPTAPKKDYCNAKREVDTGLKS